MVYLVIPVFFLFSRMGNGRPLFTHNAVTHNHTTVAIKTRQRAIPETGKDIYQKYCISCHQRDGSGVPSTYPSLQKNSWVNGDKKRLIMVVLYGLNEEIEVNGETYNGTMPAQDYLTDKQIALVLTYLRQNFGNKASVVNPIDVKIIRKVKIAGRLHFSPGLQDNSQMTPQ